MRSNKFSVRKRKTTFLRTSFYILRDQGVAVFLEESGDNEADDGHNVDKDVHRRTGGVLEGVTNGVTDDASRVRVGSFAAIVAVFDMLFSVVPGPTSIGHETVSYTHLTLPTTERV